MTSKERIEAKRKGQRVFRVRHEKTGAWWEGIATDSTEALRQAADEMNGGALNTLHVREFTHNGAWKKC